MRRWTAGELIELEHIADQCELRALELVKKLSDENDKTPAPVLRKQIRKSTQTAEALRDFCAIERSKG